MQPGGAPWLANIHLFGVGSTLGFGPPGSSINAPMAAAPKVVAGVTRGLFASDLQRHWESSLACDIKQVELDLSRIVADHGRVRWRHDLHNDFIRD